MGNTFDSFVATGEMMKKFINLLPYYQRNNWTIERFDNFFRFLTKVSILSDKYEPIGDYDNEAIINTGYMSADGGYIYASIIYRQELSKSQEVCYYLDRITNIYEDNKKVIDNISSPVYAKVKLELPIENDSTWKLNKSGKYSGWPHLIIDGIDNFPDDLLLEFLDKYTEFSGKSYIDFPPIQFSYESFRSHLIDTLRGLLDKNYQGDWYCQEFYNYLKKKLTDAFIDSAEKVSMNWIHPCTYYKSGTFTDKSYIFPLIWDGRILPIGVVTQMKSSSMKIRTMYSFEEISNNMRVYGPTLPPWLSPEFVLNEPLKEIRRIEADFHYQWHKLFNDSNNSRKLIQDGLVYKLDEQGQDNAIEQWISASKRILLLSSGERIENVLDIRGVDSIDNYNPMGKRELQIIAECINTFNDIVNNCPKDIKTQDSLASINSIKECFKSNSIAKISCIKEPKKRISADTVNKHLAMYHELLKEQIAIYDSDVIFIYGRSVKIQISEQDIFDDILNIYNFGEEPAQIDRKSFYCPLLNKAIFIIDTFNSDMPNVVGNFRKSCENLLQQYPDFRRNCREWEVLSY